MPIVQLLGETARYDWIETLDKFTRDFRFNALDGVGSVSHIEIYFYLRQDCNEILCM